MSIYHYTLKYLYMILFLTRILLLQLCILIGLPDLQPLSLSLSLSLFISPLSLPISSYSLIQVGFLYIWCIHGLLGLFVYSSVLFKCLIATQPVYSIVIIYRGTYPFGFYLTLNLTDT